MPAGPGEARGCDVWVTTPNNPLEHLGFAPKQPRFQVVGGGPPPCLPPGGGVPTLHAPPGASATLMSLIERYILKIAFNAFAACLIALTGVIWITQALRELDLLTGKGQTILVFLTVTGLSLPALITVISPVALFIAVIYTLHKLNQDSELIVMSAAGMPPRQLIRPFVALGLLV